MQIDLQELSSMVINGVTYRVAYHEALGWINPMPLAIPVNFLDVVEASEILGVHPESVRRLIRQKRLVTYQKGRAHLLKESDILSMAKWYHPEKRRGAW